VTRYVDMLLPSSPRSLCSDRFSLTDLVTEFVPSWSVIQCVLSVLPTSTSQLIEQLDTISVTFRGIAGSDFVYLERFLDIWDNQRFFGVTWPLCVRLALEMPSLFPTGSLPPLTQEDCIQEYSQRQIACLVLHQFLCTLDRPHWMQDDGSPDFHIWYGAEQPHPKAVYAYLYALFTYFDCLAAYPPTSKPSIFFTLKSSTSPPIVLPTARFLPLTIHKLSTTGMIHSLLGLPSGACVISANKYIGFGRTGTQEEMHAGSTPEACTAVLVTPPLCDGDVLVVRGVQAMIEMDGYGRDAKLKPISETGVQRDWSKRTMLFMDALELDSFDTQGGYLIPDVLPGNVNRELMKSNTAFDAGLSINGFRYAEVITGLWGCGAFGGNAEIKAIIQWCAASIAGVPLVFVCESVSRLSIYNSCCWLMCGFKSKVEFLAHLEEFAAKVEAERWIIGDVVQVLRQLRPGDEGSRSAFRYIAQILEKRP
jgi:poly(ADP-ribose) glycohydrolase